MMNPARRSDRHLKVLAGAECDLFAGFDLDDLTGHRMVTPKKARIVPTTSEVTTTWVNVRSVA
jgi:hypothetical protein